MGKMRLSFVKKNKDSSYMSLARTGSYVGLAGNCLSKGKAALSLPQWACCHLNTNQDSL